MCWCGAWCVHVGVLVPEESRRDCWLPWSWNYRWLGMAHVNVVSQTWVLCNRSKLTSAQNHLPLPPPHYPHPCVPCSLDIESMESKSKLKKESTAVLKGDPEKVQGS